MYCFDDFRIDAGALHIFRGGVQVEAPPQAVEVLAYLIENNHRTVTRQELVDRFWPRAGTGAEAALNTCIRRVRAMLDDSAEEPKYVQTRPRSGYRFVGVLAVDQPLMKNRRFGPVLIAGAAIAVFFAGWALAFKTPAHQSLAVEPVLGLCEYTLFPKFNAGLRESLLAETLGRLPRGYEIVEPGMNPDYRLRTTVRQTPEKTVATITLVRRRDGVLIFSEEVVEPTNMNDYVPVQQKIAIRIAASVSRALEISADKSETRQLPS